MVHDTETSSAPTDRGVAGRTPTQRRTQRERRSHAEQSLLDAAAALFARRGVEGTSLADVGAHAGYSRGLVNHHFGSKAALVQRLAQRSQRDFAAGLADVGGGEVEALVMLVGAYLSAIGQDVLQARAFFVMWGAALPEQADLREVTAAGDAKFRAGLESVLRAGQQNDTITSEVDAPSVAATLVGMLRGIGAQFLVDPEGIDLAAARESCEQFVRKTLTPAAGSRRKATG
jgi:AcrR family transcriptional regulator